MTKRGTDWRTVLVYAPIFNGRAERMVATIKQSVGRIKNDVGRNWDAFVGNATFGYRWRAMNDGHSPFNLFYGV